MACRTVMRSLMALLIAADQASGSGDTGQVAVVDRETIQRVIAALDLMKPHDAVLHQKMHSVLMSATTFVPKRIEQFEQQIHMTTMVLGGRFVEIMNQGVLDFQEADRVMETLIKQLLGANGHLDGIKKEVTEHLAEFSSSSIQDKDAKTLKATIAFEKDKIAALKRQAEFFQALYNIVSKFCRPEQSDVVLQVILTVVCTLLTCCAGYQLPTGKASKVLLGSLFIFSILGSTWLIGHKLDTIGPGPDVRGSFEDKVYERKEQVRLLEKMDSWFFKFFTGLDKSIEALQGHSITLKGQKEQLQYSKAGKIDCGGCSVGELGQFLQKDEQSDTAVKIFQNKSVNGATFMDETIVTTKVLSDWGLESFDVKKLMALRGRCKSGTGFGNAAAKALAAAVTQTLENVKKDAAQLRPLLTVPQ